LLNIIAYSNKNKLLFSSEKIHIKILVIRCELKEAASQDSFEKIVSKRPELVGIFQSRSVISLLGHQYNIPVKVVSRYILYHQILLLKNHLQNYRSIS
jgi:hypothetical protein